MTRHRLVRPKEPLFWRLLSRALARPWVARALIKRATRTPHTHIWGNDGTLYMERFWLFNRYDRVYNAKFRHLPSIALHITYEPDRERAQHDHPLRSRAIILHGGYAETRGAGWYADRFPGDTYAVEPKIQYHRISKIFPLATPGCSPACVSLWITWPKRPAREYGDVDEYPRRRTEADGDWGFMVDGRHVPAREYLKRPIWMEYDPQD